MKNNMKFLVEKSQKKLYNACTQFNGECHKVKQERT